MTDTVLFTQDNLTSLSLADQVLLCPAAGQRLDEAVAAAALRDLEMQGKIRADKKHVEVLDQQPVGNAGLDKALSLLVAAGRARTPVHWIDKSKFRKAVRVSARDSLAADGLIKVEPHRFLGLVPYRKFTPAPDAREPLTKLVHSVVGNPEAAARLEDQRQIFLLALIQVCGMTSGFFATAAERRAVNKQRLALPLDEDQEVVLKALRRVIKMDQTRQAVSAAQA